MLIWYLFTMRSVVKVNRREWEVETMRYFIELWKIAFYKLIVCYLLGRRAFTGRLTQCQYFIFIGLKCYMNALDISLLVRIPCNFLLFDYTHSMRHWKASTCAKMLYSEYMNQYWLVTTKWKIVHALFSSIESQRAQHLRSFRIRYRINMFIILRTFEMQHQKLICLNDFSSMSFHCDSFVHVCSLRAIDLKPWKIE